MMWFEHCESPHLFTLDRNQLCISAELRIANCKCIYLAEIIKFAVMTFEMGEIMYGSLSGDKRRGRPKMTWKEVVDRDL